MNLKQSLTEEEILTMLGILQVNLQIANQNIKTLLIERDKLQEKVYELEKASRNEKRE